MNFINQLSSLILILMLVISCLNFSFGATIRPEKIKQAANLRQNNLFYRQFAMLR